MTFRVHVVFTGGTIGSSSREGSTALEAEPPRQLLSHVPNGLEVRFSESEPFQILSEDAGTEHWTEIVKHVASLDMSRLDAVVVAHGSDTLAWTAQAMAYALAGIPKPVVLVASDRPLSDSRSNGPANFRDALSFALGEKLPGVFVAWKNPQEATSIHLATRLLPCDVHDDRFRSALDLHFGQVVDGEFRRNAVEGNPSRSHLANPDPGEWEASRRRALEGVRFEPRVLLLWAQPGTDHGMFAPEQGWKAAIQLAYHSGTARSTDGEGSFVDLSRRFLAAGVAVVVGPCRDRSSPYESVDRLRAQSVLFAPSMAESALVVKARWLLGAGRELSALAESVAFDLLPETTFRR